MEGVVVDLVEALQAQQFCTTGGDAGDDDAEVGGEVLFTLRVRTREGSRDRHPLPVAVQQAGVYQRPVGRTSAAFGSGELR